MADALDLSGKKPRGKPFVKGDPRRHMTGRPKGARGKRAAALLELLRPEGEKLLARAVALALHETSPEPQVLRDLLGRLLPPVERATLVKFKLPAGVSLVEQSAAVLQAVAAGELTPEEGARLAASLAAHARVIEVVELDARLARIEAQFQERARS